MTRLLTSAVLILSMIGCGSDSEPEVNAPPPGTIPDLTDPTEKTTEEPTPCEGNMSPDFFALRAFFGYDEKNERFSNYALPEVGLVPITYAVTYIDSVELRSCDIIWQVDTRQPNAAWVEEQSAWAGMDLPDDAVVFDGCEGCDFPPIFTDGEPPETGVVYHTTKWDWGFGVGPLNETVQKQTQASMSPAEWSALEPFLVGGAIFTNLFEGSELSKDGYTDFARAIGYEVDGNFQLDLDGAGNTKPIDKDLVNAPGGIATGYYEVELVLTNPVALTNPVR